MVNHIQSDSVELKPEIFYLHRKNDDTFINSCII